MKSRTSDHLPQVWPLVTKIKKQVDKYQNIQQGNRRNEAGMKCKVACGSPLDLPSNCKALALIPGINYSYIHSINKYLRARVSYELRVCSMSLWSLPLVNPIIHIRCIKHKLHCVLWKKHKGCDESLCLGAWCRCGIRQGLSRKVTSRLIPLGCVALDRKFGGKSVQGREGMVPGPLAWLRVK